jgi:hypothetical protein
LALGTSYFLTTPKRNEEIAMAVKDGITVNPKSEISGPKWMELISRSNGIPDHYKKQLHWKHGKFTTPKLFRDPPGVIQKVWRDDWLSAFLGNWEISAHHLDIIVETRVEAAKRHRERSKKSGQRITVEVVPHLSKGETVPNYTFLKKGRAKKSLTKENLV